MSAAKEIHVARQPIFDRNLKIYAYELLFRSNAQDNFNDNNADQATYDLISNAFLTLGFETLTKGKRAFINFTGNSLKNKLPFILPHELVVVELLEDIPPNDQEIYQICSELKSKGYLVVLDDFIITEKLNPLVELADIIKIDFKTTSAQQQVKLMRACKHLPIKWLAEKVETYAEFKIAVEMGYTYFQGYFFSKPVILSSTNIPANKLVYMQILKELNKTQINFVKIEDLIKSDVSLSYKLLKFINSSFFGFKSKIKSIKQVLALLGERELSKWLSIIALKNIADDKPGDLVTESLIRAKFLEKLAKEFQPQLAAQAFLLGMFSYIDVLLNKNMREILEEINLDKTIKEVLVGENANSLLFLLLMLVDNYEKGNWDKYFFYASLLKIEGNYISEAYRDALLWSNEVMTL